jgi:drug/metabolite transporter (DMT)-like permease
MWLLLSLGTAFCAGTSDALAKKALEKERVGLVAWVRSAWGSVFLVPLVFLAPAPANLFYFWSQVAMALPLEALAAISFQMALRVSPMSTCLPFLAFTPVALLLTGWTFLGEKPTLLGVAGVILVAAGAFVLLKRRDAGAGSLKGPLLILLVATIYSITAIFAKRALDASTPLYFCGSYYAPVALALTPFQLSSPTWKTDLFRRPKLFASIGALEAGAFLFQFHALLYGEVAYTLAIKRLSLLLSVVYGRFIFEERNLRGRLIGAGLMVAGAILITLA